VPIRGFINRREEAKTMAKYIGALDLGTTSNRFILFEHQGRIIGFGQDGARTDLTSAGLAMGFWSDSDELRHNWSVDKNWEPQMDPAEP